MWSQAASTIPVAGIFGGILGRYLDEILRGVPRRYLIGYYQMRGVATGALGRTPPRTPT
jgi:hypothetical protein